MKSENQEIKSDVKELKTHNARFQIHRFFLFLLVSFAYAICLFLRSCPSIVADKMAEDYGKDKAVIGIFTSIYFYTYGLIQPFVGLFVDVAEPGFIIGGSLLLGSVGTFVCGLSKNLAVGCLGRALVGIGCGPVYVSANRCLINWFQVHQYAFILGVMHSIGSLGYLFAQGPLAYMSDAIGWRASFYVLGVIGLVLGILNGLLVRGNPVVFHYLPINQELSHNAAETPIKEKFQILFSNFKTVIGSMDLWICVFYAILTNGPFYDINGMWATQFLEDIYGYSSTKAGNTMMVMTISGIIGNVLVPPICYLFKTRKWVLVITAFLSGGMTLIFSIVDNMSLIAVCIVFFLYAFIGSTCSSLYSLAVDYFDPKLAGSAIGIVNFFLFIISAIYMSISSGLLDAFGKIPNSEKYSFEGYKYGVWIFNTISYFLGGILSILMVEEKFVKKENEKKQQINPKVLVSIDNEKKYTNV